MNMFFLISVNGRQLGFDIILVLVNPFGAKLFSLLRIFPSENDAAELVSFCPQRVVESTGWVCFCHCPHVFPDLFLKLGCAFDS